MSIRDAFLAVSSPTLQGGMGVSPLASMIFDISQAITKLAESQKIDSSLMEKIKKIPDFDGVDDDAAT
jgi:hypothetical protein